MISILLQTWGGLGYLLNKVLFSRAERSSNSKTKKNYRIWSWIAYLSALPAWIIVFISEDNWIAAAVEFGGAPSMIMGLLIALKGNGKQTKYVNHFAKVFVLLGLCLSLNKTGGLFQLTQLIELGIACGFLLGTYFLAKDALSGYLWLVLGNISCAILMGLEEFYILMSQQIISLLFVLDAYFVRRRNLNRNDFIKD
ncbi:hypothetical protein [Ekhidna sp.]|uniref:hypothetical protein n=1 Tax=Ekhidna sp. TaxID=2608089 RepID=UPI003297A73B